MRPRRSRQWFRYTLPGAAGALVFTCLAFTLSLLPRGPVVQGLVCGISAAIGYGVGVVSAWVWRAFADRAERPARPTAWRIFAVVAVIALLAAFVQGQRWQSEIRDLMRVAGSNPAALLLVPVLAAVVFVALVALARGLRAVYRLLARLLDRWIGPRAARAVGWVAVVGVTIALVSGVLLDGLVSAADEAFSVRNGITTGGAQQPTVATRSGGPGSLVAWDTLGREGRKFTGLGPGASDISAVTGEPALAPIRTYAGLESAESTEDRANLAVADLERAGGFDRRYLVVATTTGSGWVDPAAIDTVEYMTGGDSAIVAIQYSYLPSWISYLVDQKRAREAGRALFDAVYSKWSALPQDNRPRLLVFGESLGSFGGETAFSGEQDLRNRTSGAIFAGPPNFNTLFREFTDNRDGGSPEVAPVYRDGRTVRFDDQPGPPIEPASVAWNGPRMLYLQHPSDPIVWWTPRLLLTEPDWLREPRGHDVLGAVRWIPFITFWQVTADLPFATEVPGGHGHKYTSEYVDAWATVLQPADWTEAKASRLREIVSSGG
ncbi:MAG TPA: alpha/beta-hydrolase family protein [Mycobacteriales bacterium]|nr:alpha/beta-hydrolase family protein [Mycobacteriales bacterium]